ncbi:glycosyltransferase [Rhodopirellula sallentina]|uniref:Glycosyl transferase group 1 n=1 Tax=Rhodopirellula sallentina SM41 TaxID=1263870 RepID=M5U0J9_9BACT|nr:glycosyltransferase [Rhodopirellula sallentina]EMI54992.1 glycosyl transferase group 1 [Rhodopirellula sallentina SM41]
MQVDLVITELDVGGAERALTRLAIGLQERGDDVRVFSLGSLPQEDRPGDGKDQLLHSLLEHNVNVASGDGAGAAQLPSVYRKLKRWLAERPDAVRQSFLFHANVLTGYAIGARKKGAGDGAWVGGVRVADPNRLRILAEGMALRKADHVVCVSEAVRAFSQTRYRVPGTRLSVIANSVETQRFRDAVQFDWSQLGWPPESRVALFVGRLHEQKNLALLQRTVDRFVDRPERKLVIAGGGPQREALTRWAEQVGHDRVRVLPWQPDVAPLIAACRVFVLPSHYEGMPNVVLEAMAAGKPVVCSRVEGSDELIGDDAEQGFEPNNDVEFVQKVDRFLEDAGLADRVGLANRGRMETDFSVQRMVDAYRDLYGRLLES